MSREHDLEEYPNHAAHWAIAIAVYLFAHLYRLDLFPNYFMCDEAIHSVLARQLIEGRGWISGRFLPTYFKAHGFKNLSLSVYQQLITQWLFPGSIVAARATESVLTLLPIALIGREIERITRTQWGWITMFIASMIPVLFLHSRTSFGVISSVSFYGAAIVFYLRYRSGKIDGLWKATLFAGLSFFSYQGAPLPIAGTALCLLLTDLKYHWKNKAAWMYPGILVLTFTLWILREPGLDPAERARFLDSYWYQPIPFAQKLNTAFRFWLENFSLNRWFGEVHGEIIRHFIPGYSRIGIAWLPFLILGIGISLKNIRKSDYRIPLILLCTSGLGVIMIGFGMTRTLFLMMPVVFLISIGVTALLDKIRIPPWIVLATGSLITLAWTTQRITALPPAKADFGLHGYQWGSSRIFPILIRMSKAQPHLTFQLTSIWANSPESILRFFLNRPDNVRIGHLSEYSAYYKPDLEKNVFVIVPVEYAEAIQSGKFKNITLLETVKDPNGGIAFLWVTAQYKEGIESVFKKESEDRKKLVSGQITTDLGTLKVRHSLLDIGTAPFAVDHNPRTLIRGYEANPFEFEIDFGRTLEVSKARIHLGTSHSQVQIFTLSKKGKWQLATEVTGTTTAEAPFLEVPLPHPAKTTALRITIENPDLHQQRSNIHIFDLEITTDQGVIGHAIP